jgi:holo-[acyl-carrier protein] synthase
MEVSIGIDCEDIARFEDIMEREAIMRKVFTESEIDYCLKKQNPAQHFAVRFAGKEAILKALTGAGKKTSIRQIEILNDSSGAPVANLLKEGLKSIEIKLSMSHCKNTAVASAIVIEK